MAMRSRIEPTAAVTLIEEAQCGTPSEAGAVLQKLSLGLCRPDPAVTDALHDLLQIHPIPTIPHIPSLIPATPSVVSRFVEAFSDLLSADRTLLVPIIGALSDLPLSAKHAIHSRSTLRFALTVVDAHDLPAVVRALTRLCANAKAPASARWAATALRDALATPPDQEVMPVLAHVLEDVCRPGNAVGTSLRNQAGQGRVSWLDLIVWHHAVKARNGPYVNGFKQGVASITAAVKGPLLAGDAARVLYAVKVAAPALASDETGVREFVRIIADVLAELRVPRLESVVNFVRLVQVLVREVPNSARGLVQELLAPSRAGSVPAELAVLGVIDVLPRDARQMASASRNVSVRVAVVTRDGDGTSAWSSVFVAIRKGLLFGVEEDRTRSFALAREIVCCADAEVVGELLAVMDNAVPAELADELAVGFLEIVAIANLRGMIRAEDACRTLDKRIEQHCPKGLIREVRVECEESGKQDRQARDEGTLQIDVGLIWEQDPAAVATVLSSAASLILTRQDLFSVEQISVGMLNVLCLVPVVCIPLYKAVEDCAIEFDTALVGGKHSRGARLGPKDIPSNLLKTDNQDLLTAMSAFAVGMAAIVGILNISSISLRISRRVLVNRLRSRSLEEGVDQKVMWTILERLTEFDRMLNALLLGYEVLKKKVASERKMDKRGKARSSKAHERSRDNANSALSKADSIRASVLKGVSARESAADTVQEDFLEPDLGYPQFSLQAIVCSLIAVPDEAGIEAISDAGLCKQTRDIELARIDMLLLRQLLRLMTSRSSEKPSRFGKRERKNTNGNKIGTESREREEAERCEGLECLQRINGALDDLDEPTLPFPYIDFNLENHDNIFLFDDDEFSDEEEVEGSGGAAIRWVSPTSEPDSRIAEYVRAATTVATRRHEACSQEHGRCVSDIIHSPCFASLLLDRAATYVAVARKGRSLSLEDSFLSSAITVAGFALGCLVTVLRIIPVCVSSLSTSQSSSTNSGKAGVAEVREFLKSMDENLVAGVPRDADGVLEEWLESFGAEGARSISTLHWISENSIDAAVAALALEALLVLSEFGCLSGGLARHAVLSSLTTIYEYDSNILWAQDDISILFQDTFGEWCLRHRRCDGGSDSKLLEGAEQAPWVARLSTGNRRHRSIDRYRLNLFFEGMHVPNALLEACGWIREITMAMLEDPNETNGGRVARAEKVSFHAEQKVQANDVAVAEKHDTSRCHALLEMTGFKTVMATLMQLVQVSLSTLTLPESFGVDDALAISTSPISHLQSALSVLCGILRLYRLNRGSLITGTESDINGDADVGPDHDLDHYIVSSTTSVMQLIRSRLDELYSWYSTTTTDLSRLSDEAVDGFEKLIGCAAQAVSQCSEMSASIKGEYLSLAAEAASNPPSADSAERETPGCARSKRKRVKEEDVSRARKLIPRLTSNCEAVTKETQKLAKAMGFRARKSLFKYAPPPLEEDPTLCFGVGVGLSEAQETHGEDTSLEDRPDTEMKTFDNPELDAAVDHEHDKKASVSGFQAGAAEDRIEAELQPKTVTVQFKR